MGNPFQLFFNIPGFDEKDFVGEKGLEITRVAELGFEEFKETTGGFVVYRKANDLGGFDYLPFVVRWWPGCMPVVDPEKDRWLAGYDRGIVLFVLDEVQNRQYVRHEQDGSVTHYDAQD